MNYPTAKLRGIEPQYHSTTAFATYKASNGNGYIVMLMNIFTHPVTLAIKPKQASGNSTPQIKIIETNS
jgi:hypothetical protein